MGNLKAKIPHGTRYDSRAEINEKTDFSSSEAVLLTFLPATLWGRSVRDFLCEVATRSASVDVVMQSNSRSREIFV